MQMRAFPGACRVGSLWLTGAGVGSSHARSFVTAGLLTGLAVVSACSEQKPVVTQQPHVVNAEQVSISQYAPILSLTGVIEARVLNDVAFRVGGRVNERFVDVGDRVEAGTLLAKLDPAEQQSDLQSAQADLDSAQANLTQATATFERQKTLLEKGFTTKSDYDAAQEAMQVAQGSVDSAKTALQNAQDALSYTELKADRPGVITARNVETGQVIQAAQAVFTVAEDGDRDAVFNVPETVVSGPAPSPAVAIVLLTDPGVRAEGKVREIAPVVDQSSLSVEVKVTIPNTPPSLPLGAAVLGSVVAQPREAVILPWEALTSMQGTPAVWLVDPASKAVSLQQIELLGYDSGTVIVSKGLSPGQNVVTAGGQLLTPGQIVEIAAEVGP